MIWRVSL